MTSQTRRPATMRDVAERAGVSRSLVSTVYRGVPGASADTKARVLQAAAELGYRPDTRARQLRSAAPSLIGVTLTATQSFHVSVVEALHEAAALRGYELSVTLNTETRTLERAVDSLLAQRCGALVLVGPQDPDGRLAALAEEADGTPVIIVDRYSEVPTIDALRIDDEAVFDILVEHLVALGHTEIWHLDGGRYVSAEPRRRAYRSAMARHGLESRMRIVPGGGTAMTGAAAALDLVSGGDLPTALVCYNDRAACGVIDVLWRAGIRIPDDLSITGIDDIPEAGMPHLSITTVEQRPEMLAAAAVTTLMDRLGGAPPAGLHLLPPGPLVVRSSTGPAPLASEPR
jgi:DNA-binding LacI/PurR family transcriptional regulator